jgi:hypothetical protein
MENPKRFKLAVIAGAAEALTYKERNPRATESEIMQHITQQIRNIINKIDEDS